MKLCVLGGDGIGPEVTAAALEVLQASGLAFQIEEAAIGFGAYQAVGKPFPDETAAALARADAALLGAVTTPPGIKGYRSPILEMRQRLGLYANLRPCASVPHPRSRPGIDLVIVRENSEGLYAGRERVEDGGDTAITERVITRQASARIVRFACERARGRPPRKLTIVHKANVLRETCGLFRRVALEVAAEFPGIEVEELLVDACAMDLLRRPEAFDVIVTTNLFGDILSDEASMLVGGLGLACSANVGARISVFEPVHGSAPDIAGRGRANPLAAIGSAALLLESLGELARAERVRAACRGALEAGETTPDLGGALDTAGATAAVVRRLG
ncbi:MAG: isocitrate/isopropylmalate dehydrogenase family protein [Planctomycetota bacterium]